MTYVRRRSGLCNLATQSFCVNGAFAASEKGLDWTGTPFAKLTVYATS
jgi:hypothetical protein